VTPSSLCSFASLLRNNVFPVFLCSYPEALQVDKLHLQGRPRVVRLLAQSSVTLLQTVHENAHFLLYLGCALSFPFHFAACRLKLVLHVCVCVCVCVCVRVCVYASMYDNLGYET